MASMAKPGGLNYFGEVLFEIMRRPPRYVDNPSELSREMRSAGYGSASQQNIDRYIKLQGGRRVPTWFCPATTDALGLDAVESEELAWAMAYGQDLTRENMEKTEVYRRHRALIREVRIIGATAGDRRR